MPIIIIFAIVVFGIFIYTWFQFRSTLKPQKTPKKSVLNKNLKIIRKFLTTSDGIKISSWYIPVRNSKAIIILIHGYRQINEDKSRLLTHATYLNKAGYSTMLIDLRSFGESEGNKIFLGTREWREAEAAYDYAKSLPENKGKKIGFYGKSMGGVISVIAKAITGKGDFIIAITPYASFKSLFNSQLQQRKYSSQFFLPFMQLAALFELGFDFEKYAPINLIKKINVPIFILGAKYDDVVSKDDAKYLFDNANTPKEFWQASTNHHEIYRANPAKFEKKILGFLSKYV